MKHRHQLNIYARGNYFEAISNATISNAISNSY